MRMARKLRNKGFEVTVPRTSDEDAPVAPKTWCFGYVSDLGDANTWGYWILAP